VIEIGAAVLDIGRHQLRVGGEAIDLPRKEFTLLRELMERRGRVVTREKLLEQVWGLGWDRDTRPSISTSGVSVASWRPLPTRRPSRRCAGSGIG
jgi:DNA-binding response OmpR family regulator